MFVDVGRSALQKHDSWVLREGNEVKLLRLILLYLGKFETVVEKQDQANEGLARLLVH